MTSLDKFKLQAVAWDSGKDSDPAYFQKWAEKFSSIVQSTEHGSPLEDFLDDKLGRQLIQPVAVPSCLKDDLDFATDGAEQPSRAQDGDDEDDESTNIEAPNSPGVTHARSATSAFTLTKSRKILSGHE